MLCGCACIENVDMGDLIVAHIYIVGDNDPDPYHCSPSVCPQDYQRMSFSIK
jgi:hypothetical protein